MDIKKYKRKKPSDKKPLAKDLNTADCPVVKKYAEGYESLSENLYEYDGNEEIREALLRYKTDLRK